MSQLMILYFVRHGESTYNAVGRIQGQIDIGLSPRGVAQGQALADYFARQRTSAIYSSPLARARQTAEPIAQRLQLPLQLDADLQEIHAGLFQGLLWSEIHQRHPQEAQRWLAQEPDFIVPGGESRRQLGQRGREALERIRASGHPSVIVVAHGGLLTAALKQLLGIPAERIPFQLRNASVTRATWGEQLRLETLNQTEHLAHIEGFDAAREQQATSEVDPSQPLADSA